MFIGKWNKAVILTYVGLAIAVVGMVICIAGMPIKYAYICLMMAGICDLFDGAVARKVKRDEEEKAFGVEQDSLVDMISFVALPIVIFSSMGFTGPFHMLISAAFAVCGVARLGYFNVVTADKEKRISTYQGVPVTYVALSMPLIYLTSLVLPGNIFRVVFVIYMIKAALFEILNIKVPKPGMTSYAAFSVMAVAMFALYMVVL